MHLPTIETLRPARSRLTRRRLPAVIKDAIGAAILAALGYAIVCLLWGGFGS